MVSIIKSVAEFENTIANAGDKLVVLDFYATWCNPCKEMDPHMQDLANLFKDRVIVIKINVDKFHDICDYYKIRSMPTFVFIKKRKCVYSFAGADPVLLARKVISFTK